MCLSVNCSSGEVGRSQKPTSVSLPSYAESAVFQGRSSSAAPCESVIASTQQCLIRQFTHVV
jgi:hypothetical protein